MKIIEFKNNWFVYLIILTRATKLKGYAFLKIKGISPK